mmetsp:Transcript_15010/g.39670  ORF Transcript_15010/g.39670 Transcript_15010/m.39670 type:complete len:210 (-) Transcript_15010:62-691(-)
MRPEVLGLRFAVRRPAQLEQHGSPGQIRRPQLRRGQRLPREPDVLRDLRVQQEAEALHGAVALHGPDQRGAQRRHALTLPHGRLVLLPQRAPGWRHALRLRAAVPAPHIGSASSAPAAALPLPGALAPAGRPGGLRGACRGPLAPARRPGTLRGACGLGHSLAARPDAPGRRPTGACRRSLLVPGRRPRSAFAGAVPESGGARAGLLRA